RTGDGGGGASADMEYFGAAGEVEVRGVCRARARRTRREADAVIGIVLPRRDPAVEGAVAVAVRRVGRHDEGNRIEGGALEHPLGFHGGALSQAGMPRRLAVLDVRLQQVDPGIVVL